MPEPQTELDGERTGARLGARVSAALTAAAVGLAVWGFLLTQSMDDPKTGGVLLFVGVSLGVVVVATPSRRALRTVDRGFPLVLLVLCLGVAPAVLAVMEIFHPHGFSAHVYEYLSTSHHLYFGPTWWTALHLVQTPLVAAVGFGLILVTRGIPGTLAWIARIVTALFIVYYVALDTLAGVGVGVLIVHTTSWTGARAEAAHELVQYLFTNNGVGGTGSALSQGGSWLAFVALSLIALTLARVGAPVLVAVLLVAGGVLIEIAHTNPYGPLGFLCVFLAAMVLVPWRAYVGASPSPV
jgi:hypothetical protein